MHHGYVHHRYMHHRRIDGQGGDGQLYVDHTASAMTTDVTPVSREGVQKRFLSDPRKPGVRSMGPDVCQ